MFGHRLEVADNLRAEATVLRTRFTFNRAFFERVSAFHESHLPRFVLRSPDDTAHHVLCTIRCVLSSVHVFTCIARCL